VKTIDQSKVLREAREAYKRTAQETYLHNHRRTHKCDQEREHQEHADRVDSGLYAVAFLVIAVSCWLIYMSTQ
jgi:hypothetical protein